MTAPWARPGRPKGDTMRARSQSNGLSLHAVAGTYVVMLGIDATDPAKLKGLLGFAIHREDQTENEQYWLQGFKTFEEVNPNPTPGSLVSTREAPIQYFLWSDYTAKANHKYVYTVVPISGEPKNLVEGDGVSVTISTEVEDTGTHAVYFNRGVIGSQAYTRKFGNVAPDKAPDPAAAYQWLSRGLEEAIIAFIGQAKGKRFGLRAAVYEFNWAPVLEAFGAAAKSGADVQIVYDHRKPQPGKATDTAVKAAGIAKLMKKRTANRSYLSHNKFIVLLEDGNPTQVWTGSTNFTESGIFGQSNVGHLVRDAGLAAAYLEYWKRLDDDEDAKQLRKDNLDQTPEPDGAPPADSTTPLFSPRPSLDVMQWYADRLDAAQKSACFTAAFGVNATLADVLAKRKSYLRYVLMEKPDKNMKKITQDANVRIAIGATLDESAANALERWVAEERNPLGVHVLYIHSKYMLLDPLGDAPTVITGSANFSDASTKNNDENMMVIQGDTHVADIYLGEFMRMFDHFEFRDVQNRLAAKPGSDIRKTAFLAPDDSWVQSFFGKNPYRTLQRKLFA
jgi:phosphatidylserine/phosphatidylglycerophosphate/cardiolipin synthase-like enzyme